jgi:hypothetical protein
LLLCCTVIQVATISDQRALIGSPLILILPHGWVLSEHECVEELPNNCEEDEERVAPDHSLVVVAIEKPDVGVDSGRFTDCLAVTACAVVAAWIAIQLAVRGHIETAAVRLRFQSLGGVVHEVKRDDR